jgi:arginine/lysine/ornithine decarboxylase
MLVSQIKLKEDIMTLLEKLKAHCNQENYPMHMPGHKRNLNLLDAYQTDITEIEGFDNLHHPTGILKNSMEHAAKLYGTLDSIYVVNGSTAALLSAIHVAVPRAGRLLMARNCHLSVYNAVMLRDLNPVYVYPTKGLIKAEDVEAALEENEDIAAAIITSPSYEGYFSDIKAISEICHKRNVTLIVDEAHGAHLPFIHTKNISGKNSYESFFGVSSLYQGADLVIQSLHKTLPAMTQTAILHRNSNRTAYRDLLRALDIYETSSPSYVLMSSIEECILYMEKNADRLFAAYKKNLEDIYSFAEAQLLGLLLPISLEKNPEKVHNVMRDPGKILIDGKKLSMTGRQIYDIIYRDYGLVAEMYEGEYCLLLTSVCDTDEGFERLKKALVALTLKASKNEKALKNEKASVLSLPEFPKAEKRLNPSRAEELPSEWISLEALEEAVKAKAAEAESFSDIDSIKASDDYSAIISATTITAYPPGVPIVTAGELINEEVLSFIKTEIKSGAEIYGIDNDGIYILSKKMN